MSLSKPDVVDLLSMNADGSEVTLHLIATEPWDPNNDQVMRLQAKLKNYVACAVDGQLERQYPESAGKNIRIEIQSDHPLSDTAHKLVEAVRKHWCEPEGIALVVRLG